MQIGTSRINASGRPPLLLASGDKTYEDDQAPVPSHASRRGMFRRPPSSILPPTLPPPKRTGISPPRRPVFVDGGAAMISPGRPLILRHPYSWWFDPPMDLEAINPGLYFFRRFPDEEEDLPLDADLVLCLETSLQLLNAPETRRAFDLQEGFRTALVRISECAQDENDGPAFREGLAAVMSGRQTALQIAMLFAGIAAWHRRRD